jgi:glycine dehydrogenase subunit 1
VVVSRTCHPDTVETLATYASQQEMEISCIAMRDGVTDRAGLEAALDESVAAVVVQFPNFFGVLEDLQAIVDEAHAHGVLTIVSFDPIAAGVYRRPGDFGADIVVGEGQALGIPLQYGAPYLGLLAARESFLRRMPGRMVGVAYDAQGRRGFALVLQTREQHIKRERATSNVCTNQGLMAMRASVYMSAIGRKGIAQVANLCLDKAHYAAERIAQVPGYRLKFSAPFFKEFVVQADRDVSKVLASCRAKNILAGVPLGRWFKELSDSFTVAVTEKRTKEDIDQLANALDAA